MLCKIVLFICEANLWLPLSVRLSVAVCKKFEEVIPVPMSSYIVKENHIRLAANKILRHFLTFLFLLFLVAKILYNSKCPFVRLSVRPNVRDRKVE